MKPIIVAILASACLLWLMVDAVQHPHPTIFVKKGE